MFRGWNAQEEKRSVVTHAKTRKTSRILAKRVPIFFLPSTRNETRCNFPTRIRKNNWSNLFTPSRIANGAHSGVARINTPLLHHEKQSIERHVVHCRLSLLRYWLIFNIYWTSLLLLSTYFIINISFASYSQVILLRVSFIRTLQPNYFIINPSYLHLIVNRINIRPFIIVDFFSTL